jgi:hypothetical protein
MMWLTLLGVLQSEQRPGDKRIKEACVTGVMLRPVKRMR